MTKIFNKFKKHVFGPFLVHFPNFWGKKKFSGKFGLSRMSYGFLAPCQNFEKTNDAIPRKRPDRRKDGQILFHRTIPPTAGDPKIYVKKKKNQNNH